MLEGDWKPERGVIGLSEVSRFGAIFFKFYHYWLRDFGTIDLF
jgi:hypothetical protein